MKKLLLILCLILSLCCLFAACDEGGDGTPTPDDSQNEEQKGETPEETPEDEETPAPEVHTHSWSAWETTKAATCTEKGEEKRTCSCGESETKEVSALGGTCVYNTQNVCTACGVTLQYTEGLEYTLNSDGESYTVTKGTALENTTDIIIPWYHEEKPVTVIGYEAFCNTALTSIQIPSTVTIIGTYAFSNCYSLTNVTFGENSQLTSIGEGVFGDCTSLASVTIPASVTSISGGFYGCYKLIEVYNLSSLNITAGSEDYGRIGYYAKDIYTDATAQSKLFTENDYIFYDDGTNRYLMGYTGTATELTLPASCKGNTYEIYKYAFYYRDVITSITIPASVTSIGDSAFYRCTSLTSVTFGENSQCTSIGDYAFDFCYNLTSITIPASVTSIGMYAFAFCDSLTSITIPVSVTSIGSSVFCGCSSLISIVIESGNTVYHSAGNCLIETASKTLIAGCKNSVIPTDGSVTSIGSFAFRNCTSLEGLTIPASVTSIGNLAFNGCTSLTSITIPLSVTSIGRGAFSGCSSLASVTFENTTGWWVSPQETAAAGMSVDISVPTNNDDLLKSTYGNYYWKRT